MNTAPNQIPAAAASSGVTSPGAGKGGISRNWQWLVPTVLIVFPLAALAAEPPSAAPAGVLQTQDSTTPGVVAELTECKRKEGVLTIKVRFHNTANKQVRMGIVNGRNYAQFYVTAGTKKYFILKDSEDTYLTPTGDGAGNLGMDIQPGASYTWWAKYPAPPADVKKIGLITPVTTPFDDVPITDQ